MSDWRNTDDNEYESESSRYRIRKFNKEKFCKKNKIGQKKTENKKKSEGAERCRVKILVYHH